MDKVNDLLTNLKPVSADNSFSSDERSNLKLIENVTFWLS